MFIIIICAGNEENVLLAGAFDEYCDSRNALMRNCHWGSPKDYEVYDFVLKNYYRLQFSPAVAIAEKEVGRNTKRV